MAVPGLTLFATGTPLQPIQNLSKLLVLLDQNFALLNTYFANPSWFVTYFQDTGFTNNIIGTVPNWSAPADGFIIHVKVLTTNTGNVTININGLGAHNVYARGGLPAYPGLVAGGQIVSFEWLSSLNGGLGGWQLYNNNTFQAHGGGVVRGSAEPELAVTFNATQTFDVSKSNVQAVTMTGNITSMTFSNPQPGQTVNIWFQQDSTGGRTVVWPTNIKWAGGTAGAVTSTANQCDLLIATYRSDTNWYAYLVNNMSTQYNTALLYHFDETSGYVTYDAVTGKYSSLNTSNIPPINFYISTVQKKFGASSARFDGTVSADVCSLNNPTASATAITNAMTGATWTVEGFFWIISYGASNGAMWSYNGNSFNFYCTLYFNTSGQLYWGNGSGFPTMIGPTTAVSTGAWHHIAVTKSGTTFTIWVDGASAGTITSATTIQPSSDMSIGSISFNSGYTPTMYVDEFRVSNIARYSAPFTPPSAPFSLD